MHLMSHSREEAKASVNQQPMTSQRASHAAKTEAPEIM